MGKVKLSKADRVYRYPKKNYLSKASSDVYYRIEMMIELYFFVLFSALIMTGLYGFIEKSVTADVIAGLLLLATIYLFVWLKKDFYHGYFFDEHDIKKVVFGKEIHYKSYEELSGLLSVATFTYTGKGIRVKAPGFRMLFHYETESTSSHDAVRKCYGMLSKLAPKKLPVWDEETINICAKEGIHRRKHRHYVYVLLSALFFFWVGYASEDYIYMNFIFGVIVTILQAIAFNGIWRHAIFIERNHVEIEKRLSKENLPMINRSKMIYLLSILETASAILLEVKIMFFMGE